MIAVELKVTGSNEVVTCLLDDDDEDLSKRGWSVERKQSGTDRVRTSIKDNGKVKSLTLARVILSRKLGRELRPNEQADHKDGNGLDNRRSNIRLATTQQNRWNKPKADRDNQTGAKGVYVRKDRKRSRFCAAITVNGKRTRLGCYQTVEEAQDAYRQASIRLHGEFSPFREGEI